MSTGSIAMIGLGTLNAVRCVKYLLIPPDVTRMGEKE